MATTQVPRGSVAHHMVTTAFELDGYKVVRALGVVRGITVRSRSLFGTIGAGLQTLVGGNITLLTELCERSRLEAFDLMLQHAGQIGEKVGQALKGHYRHLIGTERCRHENVLLRIGAGNRPRRTAAHDLPFRSSRGIEHSQIAHAVQIEQHDVGRLLQSNLEDEAFALHVGISAAAGIRFGA